MDVFEHELSKERLLDAVDVLNRLREAFDTLVTGEDEDSRRAVVAAGECIIAGLRLVEFAGHLAEGLEFYDALRASARGEMKLSPGQSTGIEQVVARMRDITRHN